MSRKEHFDKPRLTALLIIAALAAGLLFVTLLLRPGNDMPVMAQAGEEPHRRAALPADVPANGSPVTTTVYLPMVAHRFEQVESVFGVQIRQAINNANGLAQAVQADVHWVRFTAFDWNKIEPTRTEPPTYNWSAVSEQSLINAEANGLELIGIIRFTPAWAQALPGVSCGPIRQDALDEYAQFLTALVERYQAPPYNVRYWELGNEPDVDPSLVGPNNEFGCWGDSADPYYGGGRYADMLKVAYPAIKAADPRAQVLIGGLLLDCSPDNPPAGKDCTPGKYLEGILLNGGGPFFDIVSFHAYTYFAEASNLVGNPNWPGSVTAIPEKTAFLRSVLTRYGYGNKALMNTEASLLCFEDTAACREKQARYIPRAYAEAVALGLRGQVYYAMICSWRYTGLLDSDLTPKPAYHAFVAATSFLSSVSYRGTASGYPAGIQGYTFRDMSSPWYVDVIWSSDGSPQGVTLPAGASAYNHFGTLIATSGAIQVDDGPVYVKRP